MATLATAPIPDPGALLNGAATMTKKAEDPGRNAEKPPIKREEKPPDGAKEKESDADGGSATEAANAKKNQAREVK